VTFRQAALLVGAIVLVAPCLLLTSAARAQEGGDGCVRWDIAGRCVKVVAVPVGTPQEPTTGDPDDGPGRNPTPLPNCRWRTIPTIPGIKALIGPPPEGMENPVLQGYQCDETDGVPDSAVGLPVAFRWADGATDAPAPMTAQALAGILYVRVQAEMTAPQVASDPPTGTPAVVDVPVFVEVTNWQVPIVDSECDPIGGLCVTMTATPSLSWTPGEPNAPTLSCSPPGSRFDPTGGSAEQQASRPGACAWAFGQRTGVEGRSAAWPGEVTVDWAVGWTATDGDEGTFPGLAFSTDVPQAVDEVQTVVADDE